MLSSQMLWPRSCNTCVAFILHLLVAARNIEKLGHKAVLYHNRLSLSSQAMAFSFLMRPPASRLRGDQRLFDRFALLVRVAQPFEGRIRQHLLVQRQRQLPSGRPGTFIRASSPRFNKSCSGAIASAAMEDHANFHQSPRGLVALGSLSLSYISRCSLAGRLSTGQTSRESWDCRACRCKPPCW